MKFDWLLALQREDYFGGVIMVNDMNSLTRARWRARLGRGREGGRPIGRMWVAQRKAEEAGKAASRNAVMTVEAKIRAESHPLLLKCT